MSPLLILAAWLAAAAVAYGVIFGSMDRGPVSHEMQGFSRAFAVLFAIAWPIGTIIFLVLEGYGGWRYRHRCGSDCPADAYGKAPALGPTMPSNLAPARYSVTYRIPSFLPVPPSPPAPTPLPRALVAGPTIAYRRWAVYTDGRVLWLGSLGHTALWTPGHPLQAVCFDDTPRVAICTAPDVHCRCGIYAMKPEADVEDGGALFWVAPLGGAYSILANVNGAVALWGRVIEHAHGYRAQYAYPVRLWLPRPTLPVPLGFPVVGWDVLEAVAARYGVPVGEGS